MLEVLEYCIAVWCSAADTHLKLLDRVVSGTCFLTGGVFQCNIAHHRSVAVLCMLYKFVCNLMPPLRGALATKNASGLCSSVGYTWCFGCTSAYL